MEDSSTLYLSKNFPDLVRPSFDAGPVSIVIRTPETADRGGVLVGNSVEEEAKIDPEVWNSHIGAEFRQCCDRYWTLKRALRNGCKDEEVKKAFAIVCDKLASLRMLIVYASRQSTTKSRLLPDIGTIVSVGEKYRGLYEEGDHVCVRPGDVYHEEEGMCFRIVRDRYDKYSGKFLYDVTDSVPLKLHEDGAMEAYGTWALAERVQRTETLLTVKPSYTAEVDVQGERLLFRQKDGHGFLTFRNPEDWGLSPAHCLVNSASLMGAVA